MFEAAVDWSRAADIVFRLLLPVVIAGIVAFIAFQQWRTARHKLALDLFDRRFANFQSVHETVRAYLAAVRSLKFPDVESDDERARFAEFWSHYDSARFLFGPDVCDCLDELSERLANLKAVKTALMMGEVGVSRTHLRDAESEVTFGLSEFRNTVARYVSLGHIAVRKMAKHELVPRP